MLTSIPKFARRAQSGVAAVEMALVLPILMTLFAVPLFIGRVCWHYTAAQKAAHDAVRYLSSASQFEMTSAVLIRDEVPVAATARAIAATETIQLNPGHRRHQIVVQCDGITCGGLFLPRMVRVHVQMQMNDLFLGVLTAESIPGLEGLLITADVSMRYVGR